MRAPRIICGAAWALGMRLISLTQGNNYAQAGFGNATVYGGSGGERSSPAIPALRTLCDDISAGSGNQLLYGGRFSNAHDTLVGGAGNDTLQVFQGNNTVIAGSGNNSIYGGTGNDWLSGNTSSTATSHAWIRGRRDDRVPHELFAGGYSTLSADICGAARRGQRAA